MHCIKNFKLILYYYKQLDKQLSYRVLMNQLIKTSEWNSSDGDIIKFTYCTAS